MCFPFLLLFDSGEASLCSPSWCCSAFFSFFIREKREKNSAMMWFEFKGPPSTEDFSLPKGGFTQLPNFPAPDSYTAKIKKR